MPRPAKVLVFVAAIGGVLSNGCASRESGGHGAGGGQASGGASMGSGGVVHSGGASATGGASSTGGATSSGGMPATGGTSADTGGRGEGGASTGTGGSGVGGASSGVGGASAGAGGASTGAGGGTGGASTGMGGALGKFSFFVTSLEAMRSLSGSANGFGGDLRFGEANGLAGADKICATIADRSMPGASAKGWRAFLSTYLNPSEVNAIDRIGQGPWYDRMGRLLAAKKADLIQVRPRGADATIVNDLPNEFGIPNHNPDGVGDVDNHDVMTGCGLDGKLLGTARNNTDLTCDDWTNSTPKPVMGNPSLGEHGPFCGHSWAGNWMSYIAEGGCGAGINLIETGPPRPGEYTVGSGGGYGAIYCFALKP